ncbi:hypothetical protein [Streptomyces sp. NPDC059452]|uniref:hypothetical protein n=1 Tax=Streptomyces sp. NPDC059452 TaxID=3346835 RepID=UPI0036B81254
MAPHEVRAVAGEALALLLRAEQRETDTTGQRARWITALEAMASTAPHAVPRDADVLPEVTRYLALLKRSSLGFGDMDLAIEEDTAGWDLPDGDELDELDGPDMPDGPDENERDGLEEPDGLHEPDAPDGLTEGIAPRPDDDASPWPGDGRTPDGDGKRDPSEEDDITRLEQAVARLAAIQGKAGSGPLGESEDADETDPQLAGLIELRRHVQQAQVDVHTQKETVAEREIQVSQDSYTLNAMHAAASQIHLEEKQVELERERIAANERENERKHRWDMRRLELEAEQQQRELELRERTLNADSARSTAEWEARHLDTARLRTTTQLAVGTSAVAVTSWLVLPGAGTAFSLLTLTPLLVVLGVLFLLTAMALRRLPANRSPDPAAGGPPGPGGAGLSWTDGVRVVPLLPLAGALIVASGLFALIAPLVPGERRRQVHAYALETLGTAERIVLGR